MKLAPAEKINLDELFKDPFKKKTTKNPEWDSGVWSKPQQKPVLNFEKEFNFDNILPRPERTTTKPLQKPQEKVPNKPIQPPPIPTTTPNSHSEPRKEKTGSSFDLDFGGLVNVQT